MANQEIGVIFRHYPYGDEYGGGEKSIHTDKLYVGRNLVDIFSDILTNGGVYQRLGNAYAYIYEDKLKRKPLSRLYDEYLNREYNFIDFFITKIKTGEMNLSDLSGIVFYYTSEQGEKLINYKIVEVIQDKKELTEKKKTYKLENSLHEHYYFSF